MSVPHLQRLSNTLINERELSDSKFAQVEKAGCGIVHLGLGAFHRAHQARYTQRAIIEHDGAWRIIGVSLRSPTVASQLNPQNGLYTLIEQDETGYQASIVNVIDRVLVAPENPGLIVAHMSHETIKVITLTITEKGYYHDPANGKLQSEHPDILHDLENLDKPKTALGFIVSAIQNRIKTNTSPFTVLSCDNLPANGKLLKNLVLEFASLISTELSDQIESTYCFPSSMVDRIVPAVTDDVYQRFSKLNNYEDKGLVVCEPYSNWVIEDNFCSGRPAWDQVGANLVTDVHSYETMKLRLLNGSHSTIAYVGFLCGYETVSDAMQDNDITRLVKRLMKFELMPGLTVDNSVDLDVYCEELLSRFRNETLHHQTYQIAMDGSQKLPQRLISPLVYQREHNGHIECICFVLAAWILYSTGQTFEQQTFEVQDPLATKLSKAYFDNKNNISAWVDCIFNINEIFNLSISADSIVKNQVIILLESMHRDKSVKTSLNRLLSEFQI